MFSLMTQMNAAYGKWKGPNGLHEVLKIIWKEYSVIANR